MHKYLGWLLIVLALVGGASAQSVSIGAGVGESTMMGGGGPPPPVQVLANGWQANILWTGVACTGSTASYSLTPDATPKITFNVTSPGFTTTGTTTTVSRTVVATIWLRQPEPNNTLPTESGGANCLTRVVLSDYINNTDTITSVAILAGAYNGSGARTVSSGIINSSTRAHAPPICARVTEDNLAIEPAATFTVEVACFHARPSGGKEVQAVIFTASDGTHTATCTTSTMTQSARITSGNPVFVYSCTFAAGAFSTFTNGNISIDAVAYPIIGDKTLDFANGQDGVPIAYTTRTPNLKPFREVYDGGGVHTPVYGWVNAGGTCSTTACISTSSTDPGTGAAANYPSIAAAAQQCQSYNNGTRSHNDYSGCVIEVRAGTWNGFNQASGATLSSLTRGLVWMTVTGAPGTTTATVIVKPSAAGTGDTNINDRIKFVGMGFAQADATSSGYNLVLVGTDSGTTNPIVDEILFDGSLLTVSADNWPMLYQVGLTSYYNSTTDQSLADGKLTLPYAANNNAMLAFGSSLKGKVSEQPKFWLYTALGNVGSGILVYVPANTSANYIAPTGFVSAFNKWMNAVEGMDINAPNANVPAGNAADVQNLYEKVTVDGGPTARFLADADLNPFSNYVNQYTTYAGGRLNAIYNDTGANCTPKDGSFRFVAFDPMASQGFNIKRDTFGTQNPARICNWPASHHVGSIGIVANQAADGTTAPSSLSWLGEYFGLGGATAVSVAFTTNASASGTNAGNGTYTITGGVASPAYSRVPSGLAALPKDLAGTVRRNDGTGCAGAYEC